MRLIPVFVMTMIGVLATPRTASAGFWDLIWEMSGPQLISLVGGHCEVGLSRTPDPRCHATIAVLRLPLPRFDAPPPVDNRVWLNLDLRHYFSTGKNTEDNGQPVDFGGGKIQMIGLDPMLAVGRRFADGRKRVYSAVGASLNHFYGSDIESFNSFAYKLQPLAFEGKFRHLTFGAAYNLRIYPKGFETTASGGLTLADTVEYVHGINLEVVLGF